MTGSVIKEFLVSLGFKIDEAGLNKFENGIKKSTIAVAAMGAAITAAAGTVVSFVSGIARELDNIADLSHMVNAASSEILRLGYVAELTDSSLAAVTSSFQGLSKAAGDTYMGMGRAKAVFEELNISVKDSQGNLKNTSVLMSEVGDKIKGLERGQQLAVLSRLGIDPTMLRALTEDTAALRAEFDAIYSAAGIDADKAAESSSDFVDSMNRLSLVIGVVKKAIGVKFMPQVQRGIDALRKFVVENLPRIINALAPVIDIVLRITEAFIIMAGRVGNIVVKIIDWFYKLNDAVDGWAGYVLMAAAAWKVLNTAFLASPIGRLITLATIIAMLVEDFATWREGGESLIDWGSNFGKMLMGITALVVGFSTAIAAARVAMAVFNAVAALNPATVILLAAVAAAAALAAAVYSIKDSWQPVMDWLGDKLLSIKETINGLIDLIGGKLAAAWDKVKGIGAAVGDAFSFGDEPMPGLVRADGFQGGNAGLLPSPQAAAAISGGATQQNVNQKTEIIVQGSSNPEATGRAIAGQQTRVNADMVRNMKGAAR